MCYFIRMVPLGAKFRIDRDVPTNICAALDKRIIYLQLCRLKFSTYLNFVADFLYIPVCFKKVAPGVFWVEILT